MNQDERAAFDHAMRRARIAAYAAGEFVGQESFMTASEIKDLALRAGIGPGVSVLDLCCGVSGPGLHITRELGCTYLGVDASEDAVRIARERAGNLDCRFQAQHVPPVPIGPFDVVLLLETMLAFPDKGALLADVASALHPGGRFAFTVEEGEPLTLAERAQMPDANTVWLVPLAELVALLERSGLRVRWQAEVSATHRVVAESLVGTFVADAADISDQIGNAALDELVRAHLLWIDWLRSGRVRKFALIAEKGPSV